MTTSKPLVEAVAGFRDGGPYDLAYVDCPWPYDDTRTHASTGAARSAYEVMTIDNLKRLVPGTIMAKRSALAVWWTGPKAQEAIEVVRSWGYEIVNMHLFTWVKLRRGVDMDRLAQIELQDAPWSFSIPADLHKGLGHYTRQGTENVMLAVRGTPRLARHDLTVREVVFWPVGRHSQKPWPVRYRLERLFGPVRRIELFARERVGGWDGWGAEYPEDDR